MNRLGRAFDQNSNVYEESFKMMEAMHHVLQRVFNDWVQNGEFTYSNRGLPDWHEYMKYYWTCQMVAQALAGVRRQEGPEQSTLVVAPSVSDERVVETHVFGG